MAPSNQVTQNGNSSEYNVNHHLVAARINVQVNPGPGFFPRFPFDVERQDSKLHTTTTTTIKQ